LFVCNAKNYSAPELARRIKGATSRFLRENFFDRIKKWLWGDHFWSRGYFAETIGRVTSESIRFYIERSQGKHWVDEEPPALLDANQKQLTAF
jgi:putative transposase